MSAARARSQRVLRCECGQFVRLDRALAEVHSDPTPAPAPARALGDADDDDDETHMFSSLEAIAALGSASSPRASRASLYDADDAAAARLKSAPANLPLPATPPARPSSPVPRSLSPSPTAAPTTDKPLWYVNLGGTETVEMTIEQLIIARRSGKLGEGAMVWRAGMPRWRSIGSLIPAAGSGAPRPAAAAVQPRRTPLTAQPLGSYERPVPTLEFALEKPELSAPREQPARSLSSASLRPASQSPGPRVPTPIPRAPGSNPPPPVRLGPARAPSPAPIPAPLPAPRIPTPTPIPARSSAPPARAVASVMPLLQRSSPLPPIRSLVPVAFQYPWRGQQPRWLSLGIAVLICIAASGSGAFLVRALKMRRQPLSLSPTPVSPAATATVGPSLPLGPLPATPAEPTAVVVDIDSLSVEHPAPRPPPRTVTLAPRVPTTPITTVRAGNG